MRRPTLSSPTAGRIGRATGRTSERGWVAVRQLIGYGLYEGEEAFQLLEEIYADWRQLEEKLRKLWGLNG